MSIRSLLLCCTLIACAHPIFACECMLPPPAPGTTKPKNIREWAETAVAAISDSKVVFEGRVERQEPTSIDIIDVLNDPHGEESMRRTVFFTVSKVYKGRERQSLKVMTGWGGGDCGFDFETGKEYLVYAGRDEQSNLETGICS